MAVLEITQAAEQRLLEITPSIPTAFEGVHFEPPTGMYQRCQFIISPPEDPVLGTGYYRERVEFQVFVSSPAGLGVGDALARAELIRAKFKKGTSFDTDIIANWWEYFNNPVFIKVHVLSTPQVAGTVPLGDRVVVPVMISLVGEVYSIK